MFTTVIGSYPFSYDVLGQDAVVRSVNDQLTAGIDLVSDGQTRSDMIGYFARAIAGYHFDGKSYITGRIGQGDPAVFLTDLALARSLAPHVKGIVTGPVTLVLSSRIKAGYQGYRDENVYLDSAAALRQIAQAMQDQGAEWIQIDEPFLSVGAPLAIAKKALESIALNLKVPVALHVCGKIVSIIDWLVDLKGITLLSHGFKGEDNLSVLENDRLIHSDKRLGLGCIDTKKNRVESTGEIAALIKDALKKYPAGRLVVHPDCGLRSLERDTALAKLQNMVAAAKLAEQQN
jgi:5-methyltetrahydropteroyltriglutamate--homocysteine methyltransferase